MRKNQPWQGLAFVGIIILAIFLILPAAVQAVATPRVSIEQGKSLTKDRKVSLYLVGPTDVVRMKISNDADFSTGRWEDFASTKTWYLDYGEGVTTVYVKFENKAGKTFTARDDIRLEPPPISVEVEIEDGATTVDSRYVTVSTTYSEGIEEFRVVNGLSFDGVEWQNIVSSFPWTLSVDSGEKTVRFQFKDASGKTKTITKKINYEESTRQIDEGRLIKGQSNTVYYLGYDGAIHPFFDSRVFHSWYENFNGITAVSDSKLRQYPLGSPVCVRQGTWLLKFGNSSRVYAVERGCRLRPIMSEVEAYVLYGKNWASKILELEPVTKVFYEVMSYDASDKDTGKEDRDKDGIDADTEEDYGSSDSKTDTDGDRLSDYEEIYYWFSDPVDSDTDDDGFQDGVEILNGYSPVSGDKLTRLPANSYIYPTGSVVWYGLEYSYISSPTSRYYVAKVRAEKAFTSNKFQEKFVLVPPFRLTLPEKRGNLGEGLSSISHPQTTNNSDKIVDL